MAFGGKEILLVDGYNVLRCGAYDDIAGVSPDFTDWTSDDFNNARLALLNDVSLYVDRHTEAYVVFDAKNNPSSELKMQKFGKVNVRFSEFGKSADETIEAICHSALNRGMQVKVVTSDHIIRDIVDRKNVVCYGAVQFCAMLKNADACGSKPKISNYHSTGGDAANDSVAHVQSAGPYRTKIEDAIDADTLRKLEALMDEIQ